MPVPPHSANLNERERRSWRVSCLRRHGTYEDTAPYGRYTMCHPDECLTLRDNAEEDTDEGEQEMYRRDGIDQSNENVHGVGSIRNISIG